MRKAAPSKSNVRRKTIMTIQQILSITSGVLLSLGGGGAILICLSGWLGKVWAERLMNKERQRHSEELARLRSDLMLRNDEQINKMRNELEIYKEKHLKEHQDKIAIYRIALDMVASMVAKIEMILIRRREPLNSEEIYDFEVQRLRLYGYLAMLAPQSVMDAHDALIDQMLAIIYDGAVITWEQFRGLALNCLNEIRKDIGGELETIEYRGKR